MNLMSSVRRKMKSIIIVVLMAIGAAAWASTECTVDPTEHSGLTKVSIAVDYTVLGYHTNILTLKRGGDGTNDELIFVKFVPNPSAGLPGKFEAKDGTFFQPIDHNGNATLNYDGKEFKLSCHSWG